MFTKTFNPVLPKLESPVSTCLHPVQHQGKSIPLSFIPNMGQSRIPSLYYSRGSRYAVHFNKSEVFFSFINTTSKNPPVEPLEQKIHSNQYNSTRSSISWNNADMAAENGTDSQDIGLVLAMQFVDANPIVKIKADNETSARVNFFYGNDPSRWQTNLPVYQEISYHDLWPGIDMVFKGSNGQIKYEFQTKPGADISNIRVKYSGADQITLDRDGNLLIHSPIGIITDGSPICFQYIQGKQRKIAGKYVLEKCNDGSYIFGFELSEEFDPSYSLVIDPGIDYSSYLGGTNEDRGHDIEIDTVGNAFITGRTFSHNFPSTPGVYQPEKNQSFDAFVTKVDPNGTSLVWSTFLGGSSEDWGNGIALDADGNVYIAGMTDSVDFPKTPGTIGQIGGVRNIFVTKLNPTGDALVWSCFGGGDGDDIAYHLDVDALQNVYITGETTSHNMPTTAGAPQPTLGGITDAFVSKINSTATAIIYCTYLGGSLEDQGLCIDVDSEGSAYIVGITASDNFPMTSGAYQLIFGGDHDGFITKVNPEGTALIYSTFLGGSAHDNLYYCHLNNDGSIYVCGRSNSDNFPTTAGVYQATHQGYYDGVVGKLSEDGSSLLWSTFLGGQLGDDSVRSINVDAEGNILITGQTTSVDFPVTADAYQDTYAGNSDAFMVKLNSNVTGLIYSSYLGGTDYDMAQCMAVDANGNAYITGYTLSDNFPVTPGVFQPIFQGFPGFADAYVTKFNLQPSPPPLGGAYRLVRYVINTTDDFPDDTQQFDADFFLVPDDRKVVHGTVRFPDGSPAPAAVIKFFKMLNPLDDPETTCDLESIGHAVTDDCGQFLLGPLPTDANVIIKVFFLKNASVIGTPIPNMGTATPIDP